MARDTGSITKLKELCQLISGVMSAAVSGKQPIQEDLVAIQGMKHIIMQLDSIV